jgi:hypothetical protein
MNKREPYVSIIPIERLEAMRLALIKHMYAGEIDGCEPLSTELAKEIERAIQLLIRGSRRSPRAKQDNLRAAVVARWAMDAVNVPQEIAVLAAFENRNGIDVESLARTYRNLVKLLHDFDAPTAAEMEQWLRAYVKTDYYKRKKKARAGKIKGK